MSQHAFVIYAAPFESVCKACEDGYELGDALTQHFVIFPNPFAASHILQLGEAVTSLTGVSAEFGTKENRCEPVECLFVDRLERQWVKAASLLEPSAAGDIQARWIRTCETAEGERPQWADEDRTDLVIRFIELCCIAAAADSDLVMLWRL